MKYISALLFFIISCSFPEQNVLFDSQQEVFDFIDENYHYEKIEGEPLQLPVKTLETLKGDCGDWCLLAVKCLTDIGIDAKFAGCIKSSYPPNYYHALVYIDGQIFETRGGRNVTNEYNIKFIFTYEETLLLRVFLL